MSAQNRTYQVGDQVIHWSYGLGKIIQMDEKELSGQTGKYYVVQIRDLTIWVPVSETGERSLRFPTPARDFQRLFRVLASPGEPLSTDRLERKIHLSEQMKDGSLESICRVVRDLTLHKRLKKMNDNDNNILERARSFLLNEWSVALAVPVQQADRELRKLLGEDEFIGLKAKTN